jgi:predicted Zn finger-like uncharacterized protein
MIITCPRCATRYLLETGVVRPPGRQVRCARCQHTWFQDAALDLPTPIPVPVEEPEYPAGPVTDKSRMLPPPPGSIAQPLPRFEIPAPLTHPPSPSSSSSRSIPGFGVSDRVRTRSRSMIGIVALVALVAGFPLLFFLLPQEIVRLWPESASLYDWLDMPVNARGFKIIATHSQEMNGSVPTIAIKGQIINETDRELEVPKIRLSVRDKDKRELYHWTVLADQQKLGPREEGSFTARLESPPPDAADLEVRFAKAGE